MDDLEKEELVLLLRTARKELVKSNAQLAHYRQTTAELEDGRRALVEALSVVDTLLATRATEDFQQRTVACTARPQSIDRAAELDAPREEDEHTPGGQVVAPPPPPPSDSTTPSSSPQASSPPTSTDTSPPPQPAAESSEEQQRVEGRDSHPQQAPQNSRPRQRSRRQKPARETVAELRHDTQQEGSQPRRQPQPRQQQQQQQQQQQSRKCQQCKRWGHTRSQCTRNLVCDYCNGRFHSSETCKVRSADQRQQELVQAVRETNQETLLALKSVTWQLQQPHPHLVRSVGPGLSGPHGTSAPQYYPWPLTPPAHALHHGVAPHHLAQQQGHQ